MAKKKKTPKKHFLFEEVLTFLKQNPSKTFNYKQIGAALNIQPESERFKIIEVLVELTNKGLVLESDNRGKYAIKGSKRLLDGIIDFTSTGDAYVNIDDDEPDVYIHYSKTGNAFQGDFVRIALREGFGRKKEGEVTEVLRRNKTEFVGTVQLTPKTCFMVPDSYKLHVDFFIPQDKRMKVQNGQKVLVRMIDWKEGDKNPSAEIIKIFGFPGEHQTEIHAIMAEFGLPMEFPDAVENAAKSLPTEITKAEIEKRRDFREILTFTIDPHDAKDFDDALSIKKLENGNYEIGVHIADVTHYLKPGTMLDEEAVRRATSVYLVDRCVPMLPEVLSNFACSLRPNEEKYTFSAVFEMNDQAEILSDWYGKTVINSDRRFTYEEVQQIIETQQGEYVEQILVLDGLAKKMRHKRSLSGSVFFDKEEVKFNLDENGAPLGVYFKRQQDAHKLIEDFMLLANRKVAELLGKPKEQGSTIKKTKSKEEAAQNNLCVYRVHDTPNNDKMNALSEFAGKFGYKMDLKSKKTTTDSLNKLLKDVSGKKEAGIIELLAVRSMPKAIYTTKNIGHYGLGFHYYTHFTSPIRRYPDVLVHRLLQARLEGKNYSNETELENLCKHSSEMEKLAADAERASIKFKQVEYMEQFVGDTFKGTISSVTDWGIYVEIVENKCEGMIRVRDLKDDYYIYEEENYRYVARNSGKVYALGDSVYITVKKADVFRKQLDFGFARNFAEKKEPQVDMKKPKPESEKSMNYEDEFFSDEPAVKPAYKHPFEGKFSETNADYSSAKNTGKKGGGRDKYAHKKGDGSKKRKRGK